MNDECKVVLLDEVNCVLYGLQNDHLKYFHNEFAVFAPNYFFSPLFKMGRWDGKNKFFMKTGKTYVNLLPEIIPQLKSFGYKIKLEDRRQSSTVFPPAITENHFSHINDPETNKPLILREYQVNLCNELLADGSGLAIAGTGAGKSFCIAAIADSYAKFGLKTIVIVPSQDLIVQTKECFDFLKLDVGEYSGAIKDTSHIHTISTWQTLQNSGAIMQNFQVVIVDECHGARGKILNDLLNKNGKHILHRFGLTGTLPKAESDSLMVKVVLGDVKYTINAHTLIEQDYLAKLHINIYQMEEDFTRQYADYMQLKDAEKLTYKQYKDSYFPDFTSEKSYLQTKTERLEWIADLLKTKRELGKGNIFCLVGSIAFGKRLEKLVPGSIFIYGKDDKKTRKAVYDLFKENDNVIAIATVNIASTGIDIKRIFNLVYIDMGKSFIRCIQTIGRGLRKAEDKDFVDVTDICSDLKYSKKHLRERSKIYRDAHYPYKKTTVKYLENI